MGHERHAQGRREADRPADRARSRRSSPGHPGFYVGEAGAVSSDKALTKLFNEQLGQAGERSVPLTLLILVLVFGSLLAAWIPLMLGCSP